MRLIAGLTPETVLAINPVPFLPVRTDLIPKRNQARQKMATLPVSRFKELAAGIYMEMERRYPEIEKEYTERYGPLHEAESEPSQPARSLPDISRQRSESGTREYSERWQSVREPSSSRDESRRAERSDRSERAERRPSQRRETRDRSRDVVRERDTSYGMDSKSLRDRSLTRDDFGKGTYSNSESEANIVKIV